MHILEKEDLEYLWHPFTPMSEWQKEVPLIIDSGSGIYLKDIHGNKYIDGVSSLWTNVHGHKKLQLDNALRRQLRKLSHSTLLGLTHKPAIQLAKKLIELVQDTKLRKVFYSDNGSTAMEVALKIAYQYWQQIDHGKHRTKKKFLTLTQAYHGDTIGSVSLGGIDLFHNIFAPLLFETVSIPSPHCYRCPYQQSLDTCKQNCLLDLERTMKENYEQIAAFALEPLIQGAGGMIIQPPGYLERVGELCKKYEILLILDEVATGFGRTGKMFAYQHTNVQPDILALAKGITGGYLPLATTLTSQKIFDSFLGKPEENKSFFHGHTYTGNPLACAVALANLKVFKQEKVLVKLAPKIDFLQQELAKLIDLSSVGEIRQQGFMVGIELVKNKSSKSEYPVAEQIGKNVCKVARSYGLILRPLGNIIVLMPPLSISDEQIKIIIDILKKSINEVIIND